MAYGLYFAEAFLAESDLSAYAQRFVQIGTDGKISMAQPGTFPEGVLENLPPAGMSASISMIGITKVEVDASYPIGTYLMAGANGVGTQVTAGSFMYTRAKTLEASVLSGDIVMIRLIDEIGPISGVTGMIGPKGDKGDTGVQGQTGMGLGLPGYQGITGYSGITGSNGIQGVTGAGGVTGSVGP